MIEMANLPSDVDIVFQDLSDVVSSLLNSGDNPRKIRQYFSQFVNLSKKLSAYLRRTEKGKVCLSIFEGWDDVSDLFYHVLRNADEHDSPITLRINYFYLYRIGKNVESITLVGHWEDDNPLDETPFDALEGRNHLGEVIKAEVTYQYDLNYNNQTKFGKKIDTYVEKIGHKDVHKLSEHYFDSLKSLIDLYNGMEK